MTGPNTRIIDTVGRLVTPGLTEAHVHLGDALPTPPLAMPALPFPGPGPTAEEILAAVEQAAKTRTDWVSAYIGPLIARDRRNWRKALDAVAPNAPVLLRAPWGHNSFTNSEGLRRLGIAEDIADPLGGWWGRDESGASTVAPTKPRRSCREYSPRLPNVWPPCSAKHNNATRVGVSRQFT